MVYCAVIGCSSNNNKKSKNVSNWRFFSFPKNKEICEQWVLRCYQQHKFNVQTARICSRHFVESDYCLKEKTLGLPQNKWKLKSEAIPSLHLIKSPKEQTSLSIVMEENLNKEQSPMAMETITEMEFVKVEIKIEPPEYHSDSFAVHQGTLDISDNYNVDEIVLSSIKSDPDITRGSIKTEVETEAGQSQAYKIKLEKHMDTATMEITEGLIVKSEDDCDRFIDVNPDMFYNEIDNDYTENEDDPKFMPTNHKAPLDTDNHYQNKYISHLHCQSSIDGESSVACKQHYVAYNKASGKLSSCCNCKNSPCCKVPLDEIMEEHKQDPDSISSASCKSSSSFKCICCNASFKTKRAMDEHVVKKHPKFKSTLSSKLHECTFCSYKTTKKDIFNNHMFK